jgi:hypothetical protein
VDVGDLVIAKADNAGGAQGSVGSSWFVVERNLAITSFGSLLIQEPDAAAVRQLLQLRLGIDVQEHRNELARYGLHAGDIASDGTVPVTSINGDFARITGTDPIGNLSDAPLGTIRTLLFQDSLNLVHSGSLSLPGADDILTAAGDVAIFRSVGVDTWLCVAYTRADGTAVVGSGGGGDPITQSNTAWVDPAGNDGTGEMSNPAKPFATWAGVLAALTTETHLTVMWGVAGPETGDLPDLDITVIGYGVGAPASGLTLLIPDNNTGGSLRVVNTQLAALGTDGAIDAVGDWHFYGIEVDGDIDFETVAGTAASHNAEDGSPGGGMGSLTFHHCYATGGLNLTTGSGGSGWEAEGEPSTNGGQAGDIAALRFERCGFEDGLNLTTGTGGDGGNGATGGDGGDLGSIFLDQQCSFRITTSYGNGGAAVSGTPGANGMVTGTYAHPRPHLQSLPGASESTDAVNLQDLQNALVLYIPTAAIVTASGTTLTLGTNHNGRYVRLTNASSCTITLPNQSTASWVANTEITIRVAAAGIPTFSLGAGVTLNDPLGLMSSLATGSTFMIKRVTSDVWDLI